MKKILQLSSLSLGLQQSAVTVAGNLMAAGFSAVALILISRLLGPVEYGQFGVAMAIVLILSRINDAGINAAVLKFAGASTGNSERNYIFSYTIKLKLILSAIIVVVGVLFIPLLTQILRFSQPALLYVAVVLGTTTTWYEQLLAMLQSIHRFTQAVSASAIQASIKFAIISGLWLVSFNNVVTVFSLYLITPLVSLLLAGKFLPRWIHLTRQTSNTSVNRTINAMVRHSAVAFIVAGLMENLDVLFAQRYLSPFETGLLAGVINIVMVIMLIAYSLGSVLSPRVARYTEKVHLEKYIKKASVLSLLSGVGFLLFVPLSGILILLTIGPTYLAGRSILIVLGAAAFVAVATIPFQALFFSLKANWYFSVSGIIQLLIVVTGNVIFVPEIGLMAIGYTRLMARLVLLLLTVGLGLFLYHRQHERHSIPIS